MVSFLDCILDFIFYTFRYRPHLPLEAVILHLGFDVCPSNPNCPDESLSPQKQCEEYLKACGIQVNSDSRIDPRVAATKLHLPTWLSLGKTEIVYAGEK